MEELTIDREFDELCPPISDEEERLLEQSLLDDGCLHPVVTWANHDSTILDGHNRYRLCLKHELKFHHKALRIETREQAKAWIIRQQIGRRNLNETQRASLAAKLVNSHVGRPNSANLPNLLTAEKAAEDFNVSERLVRSAAKVQEHGSAALNKAMDAGEIPASTAAVIAELPKAEQKKIVAKGPGAAKAAARKVKEPKQYKDSFDTAKLDKDLKKEKKPGSVKKEWSDQTLIEAVGQFAKEIDTAYAGFLRLIEECNANAGGREPDVARARRAAHQGKAESHKLLRGLTDAFRLWRPAK